MACPVMVMFLCLKASFWPEAIFICSFTISIPVTSSVMGCSTCTLVFISMK